MKARTAVALILNRLPYPYRNYETVLKRFLDDHSFNQADVDFIQLTVRGIIIYQKLLDFIIGSTLQKPIKKLEIAALNLLRLGAFQRVILHTPLHALVNETVSAARELQRPDLTGLINAVLRHLPSEEIWQAKIKELPPVEAIATEFSHPVWLVQRWLANFGAEATRQLLEFNNTYQEIIWRANPLKIDWSELSANLATEGYRAKVITEKPVAFFTVNEAGRLIKSTFFQEGLLSVQDYSQALVVQLLNPQSGETILDVCAAPGGKTTYIAQLTGDSARIFAYDIQPDRVAKIALETRRLGIDSINFEIADARQAKFPLADKILVDAPCTGTGVCARRANLRWNRSESDLAKLTGQQREILKNVARYLREGGILVYSTCSLEPEENWEIVEGFVNNNPQFVIDSAHKYVPEMYCDKYGAIQVLPFKHKLTGSFAVRLVKTSEIV